MCNGIAKYTTSIIINKVLTEEINHELMRNITARIRVILTIPFIIGLAVCNHET